ncbi:Crp/Fnr family transcriptional regulator [Winogradskyella sp. PG-2]|uniref:Crp/Fnr family transcriptional regulator n=1 Tax=Winogradskyella sp. PG-2 TaxID=754409 RepID=UPI00045893E3|nr:Crp/Fnr family transcriptional regulator [Winogradskyella sp. PG-2]BAO76604.1 cAMP-binding proteins - catabolite gene activator and regulatory subunit of cAMP-dependent protein kinases [Winogradskyella sp. PG-2]
MIKFNPVILESKPFAELIEQSEYFTFEKKEIIVQANHVCNYLYLIESGLLRSYYLDLKGNEITHWFASESMFMTIPPSFFNREESQFNIEAVEKTTVRAFSIDLLENAFEKNRVIETFCRVIVTQVMISLGKKVIDLKTKTAEERYKELKVIYPNIFKRASLGQIASYLGITQQSLSRIRSKKK